MYTRSRRVHGAWMRDKARGGGLFWVLQTDKSQGHQEYEIREGLEHFGSELAMCLKHAELAVAEH